MDMFIETPMYHTLTFTITCYCETLFVQTNQKQIKNVMLQLKEVPGSERKRI